MEKGSLQKIQEFQANVKSKILKGEIKNNFELLEYSYEQGHIGNHAAEVLKKMKKDKELDYESTSPLVTYENVYSKAKKKITYKILKNGTN